MDETPAVFDAADLTWSLGSMHWRKAVIGDFQIHLNADGSGEILAADDAVVIDLDEPAQ